jgi:hypothetical protein
MLIQQRSVLSMCDGGTTVTLEMGAETVTYGRPAADAFDLPAALAARERRDAERRLEIESAVRPEPTGETQRMTDRAERADELPPEFVPWSDR